MPRGDFVVVSRDSPRWLRNEPWTRVSGGGFASHLGEIFEGLQDPRDGSVAAAHEDAQVGHLAGVPLERLARTASANVDDVQGVEIRSLREERLEFLAAPPAALAVDEDEERRVGRGGVQRVGRGFRGRVRARGIRTARRVASCRRDGETTRPRAKQLAPARGGRGGDASRTSARRARA